MRKYILIQIYSIKKNYKKIMTKPVIYLISKYFK